MNVYMNRNENLTWQICLPKYTLSFVIQFLASSSPGHAGSVIFLFLDTRYLHYPKIG